jgi:hypothetical protein
MEVGAEWKIDAFVLNPEMIEDTVKIANEAIKDKIQGNLITDGLCNCRSDSSSGISHQSDYPSIPRNYLTSFRRQSRIPCLCNLQQILHLTRTALF